MYLNDKMEFNVSTKSFRIYFVYMLRSPLIIHDEDRCLVGSIQSYRLGGECTFCVF